MYVHNTSAACLHALHARDVEAKSKNGDPVCLARGNIDDIHIDDILAVSHFLESFLRAIFLLPAVPSLFLTSISYYFLLSTFITIPVIMK